MKNTRKIVISRTAILGLVLAAATAFVYAVYEDRTEGSLMDEEGVIDKELIEPLDQQP